MSELKPLHSLLRLDRDRHLVVNNPGDFLLYNSFISHTFQAFTFGRSFQDYGQYPQAIASYALAMEFDDIDQSVAVAKRQLTLISRSCKVSHVLALCPACSQNAQRMGYAPNHFASGAACYKTKKYVRWTRASLDW